MENESKGTLQRWLKVLSALKETGIAKASQNSQQRYMYRGIDDVQKALAPLLAEHGVAVFPSTVERASKERVIRDKIQMHHCVKVAFTIVSEEGALGPFYQEGECLDMSDKGLTKAQTAAFKYWILSALCVPTDGVPDADSDTPEMHNPPVQQGPSQAMATPEQLQAIAGMLGDQDPLPILEHLGVQSFSQLTEAAAAKVLASMRKKLQERETPNE